MSEKQNNQPSSSMFKPKSVPLLKVETDGPLEPLRDNRAEDFDAFANHPDRATFHMAWNPWTCVRHTNAAMVDLAGDMERARADGKYVAVFGLDGKTMVVGGPSEALERPWGVLTTSKWYVTAWDALEASRDPKQ